VSSLGFTGAGGVGRPFTIQDLFGAVTPVSTSGTSSSIINQYMDEVDTVIITDTFTITAFAPVVYDGGVWEDGSWT
jgi:predicted GTPase